MLVTRLFIFLSILSQGEGEHAEVKYVGVSHSGIRFLRRERSLVDDNFEVLDFVRLKKT
jgi:hypothetical protein